MDSISLTENVYISRFAPRTAGQAQTKASGTQEKTFSAEQDQQEDTVSLSPDGRRLSARGTLEKLAAEEFASATNAPVALTEAELKELQQLKSRDIEVRTHEQAHLSSAGQYAAGGASFTYQNGPDGNRYAVGGEVPIDISREKTPEETIQKMQVIKRAALAPASPSGADRQIAAQASATEAQARQEVLRKNQQELDKNVANQATTQTPPTKSPDTDHTSRSTLATNNTMGSRRAMISAYSTINAL
jgi:hypothetical protein